MFFTSLFRIFLISLFAGFVLADDYKEKDKSVSLNSLRNYYDNIMSYDDILKKWYEFLDQYRNATSNNPAAPKRPVQAREKRALDLSSRASCSCIVRYDHNNAKASGRKCTGLCQNVSAGSKSCYCSTNGTTTTTTTTDMTTSVDPSSSTTTIPTTTNNNTTPTTTTAEPSSDKCYCSTQCFGKLNAFPPSCTSTIDFRGKPPKNKYECPCRMIGSGPTSRFTCVCT